jgi:outer membrane lipoprotein-sorting protein
LKYLRVLIVLGLFALVGGGPLAGQEIQTAQDFFDRLSQRYGQIEDYTAQITMTTEDKELRGTLYYKKPDMVRIDFSQPEDQVLVSNGGSLKVYIPDYNVVLQQSLSGGRSGQSGATLASSEGLALLRSNYSIAYQDSPTPVPLEEGSDVMVTKLQLDWRSTTEGFRKLIISVTETFLIRRIVGTTANYEEIQFDFEDIRLNQNLPEARFDYEAPASANMFPNFLFEQES